MKSLFVDFRLELLFNNNLHSWTLKYIIILYNINYLIFLRHDFVYIWFEILLLLPLVLFPPFFLVYEFLANLCSKYVLRLLKFNADLSVAYTSTGGATPALRACSHLSAQRHHLSPDFNPGKLLFGVIKSFPFFFSEL